MENNQMFRVTMGQTVRDYPAGTTFQTIADQVQGDYPHDVLLVNRNGKLCELHKKLDRDCALTMVTAQSRSSFLCSSHSFPFRLTNKTSWG